MQKNDNITDGKPLKALYANVANSSGVDAAAVKQIITALLSSGKLQAENVRHGYISIDKDVIVEAQMTLIDAVERGVDWQQALQEVDAKSSADIKTRLVDLVRTADDSALAKLAKLIDNDGDLKNKLQAQNPSAEDGSGDQSGDVPFIKRAKTLQKSVAALGSIDPKIIAKVLDSLISKKPLKIKFSLNK